jgi:hypothetical protein
VNGEWISDKTHHVDGRARNLDQPYLRERGRLPASARRVRDDRRR